ncbi:enoyl-CoA hydratase/isomerase family protein [Caldivirga maquilingensis]|uniref:Enoyl-CoA hydratase/isomerase n=1 Tax=Caldivirga maquilingensis (strain ATCC 700844 / DSM 13496 / JCM 10307 / IC-167) TaxID=397948 RepID=A8MBJ7_CALMQ|nr:enoyl-CoA hydratase/isomerase family protein [Caldivirga maquilingensis]ABW02730.1 Enoyl-CoA hydratase/isomerase [Caldivirga maquilingensis IC-167]
MMLNKVKVWNEDGVGVIAIDNGLENPLDLDALIQLMTALTTANRDAGVNWVALTATGSSFFTTGIDWDSVGEDYDSVRELVRVIKALVSFMVTLDKPIVTILNGSALGLGLELAVLSDLTIAPPDVYLCYPEGAIGIPPVFSMPRLQQALPRMTLVKLLSGNALSSSEAEKYGLIHLVPRGNLLGDAKSIIRGIRFNSLARRIMNEPVRGIIDEAEAVLLDALMSRCLTHSSREELIKVTKEAKVKCRSSYLT